jgi:hypothetical protein
MMQMKAHSATDLGPGPMIAGAIPLIDVSGHLRGDVEASHNASITCRAMACRKR